MFSNLHMMFFFKPYTSKTLYLKFFFRHLISRYKDSIICFVTGNDFIYTINLWNKFQITYNLHSLSTRETYACFWRSWHPQQQNGRRCMEYKTNVRNCFIPLPHVKFQIYISCIGTQNLPIPYPNMAIWTYTKFWKENLYLIHVYDVVFLCFLLLINNNKVKLVIILTRLILTKLF